MSAWIYPKTMVMIKNVLSDFLLGKVSVNSLQACLYQAEQKIDALEERWLRHLFCNTENKIEEINYTVSGLHKDEAIREVVQACLEQITSFERESFFKNDSIS